MLRELPQRFGPGRRQIGGSDWILSVNLPCQPLLLRVFHKPPPDCRRVLLYEDYTGIINFPRLDALVQQFRDLALANRRIIVRARRLRLPTVWHEEQPSWRNSGWAFAVSSQYLASWRFPSLLRVLFVSRAQPFHDYCAV